MGNALLPRLGTMVRAAILVILIHATGSATTHIIHFGVDGFTYNPSSLSVSVGDSIQWQGNFGLHPLSSTAIPGGAASWHNGSGSVFNYVVVVPGSYDYHCDNHFPSGMTGSFNATATDVDNRQSLPGVFRLEQNYPNPFNPTTEIQFTIGNRQLTTVDVFDVTGSVVATLVNGVKEPGTYTVRFDGRDLASGVYLYRLRAGDFEATRKFLLLR